MGGQMTQNDKGQKQVRQNAEDITKMIEYLRRQGVNMDAYEEAYKRNRELMERYDDQTRT
jgi:hypothetical protein